MNGSLLTKLKQFHSMTSAVQRSTPSLAIPSSPNTAPVLEFRCLYTHDLRRKQKRWQDGFLRFHTFNKRVMVYDVPRNFIGDSHWRDGGTVQDGDELELEKGVLVQVGEVVGSMEQDLTELLHKRRVNPGSPAAKKATAMVAANPSSNDHASTPITQLRPKSLNALLGTPRGPYGRATLPTQSPFEQRHSNEKSGDLMEGRTPKRQRINPLPTCVRAQQSQPVAKGKTSQQTTRALSSTEAGPARPLARPQASNRLGIIEVESSGDERAEPVHTLIQNSLGRLSKGTITTKATKQSPPAPLFCSSSPPVSTTNHLPPMEIKTGDPLDQHGSVATPAAETPPLETPCPEDEAPLNPLRLAVRKPRRKLMYKELLPPIHPPKPFAPRNEPGHRTSKPRVAQDEGLKKDVDNNPTIDCLNAFHKAQRKRLDARKGRQNRSSRHPQPEPSPWDEDVFSHNEQGDMEEPIVLSPIAPKQLPDAGGATSKTRNTSSSNEDSHIARQPPLHTTSKANPTANPTETTSLQALDKHLLKPTNPSARSTKTTYPQALDQQLLAPSNVNHFLLRRSNSEPNKSTSTQLSPPVPPLVNNDPHSNNNVDAQNSFQAPQPRPKKSPLKKWTSLPAPPRPPNAQVAVQKAEGDVDDDVGPWSREAFDLFDWRPPGRETPLVPCASEV